MSYRDLAEHVGALVTLLGLFAGISGVLFGRMLVRMERKLDRLGEGMAQCQAELPQRFVSKEEVREERDAWWGALHRHAHGSRGRVAR